jgi:hypothetical protein
VGKSRSSIHRDYGKRRACRAQGLITEIDLLCVNYALFVYNGLRLQRRKQEKKCERKRKFHQSVTSPVMGIEDLRTEEYHGRLNPPSR